MARATSAHVTICSWEVTGRYAFRYEHPTTRSTRPSSRYLHRIERPINHAKSNEIGGSRKSSTSSGRRGVGTQYPAMPEPVDGKGLLADDTESGPPTEFPHLGNGISMHLSPFNPLQQPRECRPGEWRFAPRKILHHQLSPWREQPPQPGQRRDWIH